MAFFLHGGLQGRQPLPNICKVQFRRERKAKEMKPLTALSENTVLTASQEAVLRAITSFRDRRGIAPTVQELAEMLSIQPPSVHEQLRRLEEKGYIQREPYKARTLTVIKGVMHKTHRMVNVPIIGKVAAGVPILAVENQVGEIPVDAMVAHGTCFALKIEGSSMIDANINNGDHIIVRQQKIAESGDIVVAMLHDEATVKRLFIADDRIELRPENKKMKPIPIGPDADFSIVGKVISVCSKTNAK